MQWMQARQVNLGNSSLLLHILLLEIYFHRPLNGSYVSVFKTAILRISGKKWKLQSNMTPECSCLSIIWSTFQKPTLSS